MGYSRTEERGLLSRARSFSGSSSEDIDLLAIEDAVSRSQSTADSFSFHPPCLRPRRHRHNSTTLKARHAHFPRARRRRSLLIRFCRSLYYLPHTILAIILLYGVLFPSYSDPPPRYTHLRNTVLLSNSTGAANPHNERVFIAASLYEKDGGLLTGHWGQSVKSLIDILGHNNVFLSIYENDPDDGSRAALDQFREGLPCESAIVYETLDTSDLPEVVFPDGTSHLRRISFLAEVRNRALRPLHDPHSKAYNTRWDKLLYLNDVAFDPIDAASLLFNTHVNEETGRTDYRAACAVDFISPFKFYDTFATRDTDGYDMGVPFYPWFTNAGSATSRNDVLAQTDAVRVKSCWSGMVAFEAKWFQPHAHPEIHDGASSGIPTEGDARSRMTTGGYQDRTPPANSDTESPGPGSSARTPLAFRAETDTYWEASECCLIHADLAALSSSTTKDSPGIFLNPYVRVAYDPSTLGWLPYTARFERLYPAIQHIINLIGRRPGYNPRQFEVAGEEAVDKVWKWDERSLEAIRNGTAADLAGGLHGRFEEVRRVATPGQFCGGRRLLYLKDGGGWGSADVPVEPTSA